MHACDIKFAVINVHGTCLIRENPTNIYTLEMYPLYGISQCLGVYDSKPRLSLVVGRWFTVINPSTLYIN